MSTRLFSFFRTCHPPGPRINSPAPAVVTATIPSAQVSAAVGAPAANGTSGSRSKPVGGYESPWWSGTIGFFHGIGTGAKAVVNQSAKAVGSLVTAGQWEPGNLIAVNPQTDIGYESAALPARIGAEAMVAAATMGASNLGRAGQVLNAVDTAGNVVNGAAGVVDVAKNGPTLQNVAQIATGGVAVVQVVGAARSIAKGCPGHSGNCFVAGTQIVVFSTGPTTLMVAANPWEHPELGESESTLGAVMMIGAGIAMAVAKAQVNNDDRCQQPGRRRQGSRRSPPRLRADEFIDPMREVSSDGRVRMDSEFRIVLKPEKAQSSAMSRPWLSRTLTAAMLLCFAMGGWFGTQALYSSHDNRALATTSASLPEYSTRNIEQIEVGDLVLARDEHGSEIGWKSVVEVYRRTSFHLRHLKFRDTTGVEQVLQTTDEHPFFVVERNDFVEAEKLQIGDLVRVAGGRTQLLIHSTRDEHPSGVPVFNFQVEDFHTYFVSQSQNHRPILVHNNNCGIDAPSGRTLTPIPDPARPVYKQGHAGKPVVDHIKARAAGGHPTDPSNLDVKPWEWNSRKGAYEGQLLKARQEYIQQGLTPAQADAVLAPEWELLMNDVLARPMDPNILDNIPFPGSR